MLVRVNTITIAAKLAFAPSKYLGMFPFIESGSDFRVCPKIAFLSGLISLAYCFFTYAVLCLGQPNIDGMFNMAEIFILNMVIQVSLYETTKSIVELNECLESLVEVNDALDGLGRRSPQFTADFRYLVAATVPWFGFFILRFYSYISVEDVWRSLVELLFIVALLAQIISFAQKYSGLLGIATNLLIFCKREILASYRYAPPSSVKRLKWLVEVHSKLCITATKLNICHKMQVLSILFSCLVISIVEACRTMRDMNQERNTSIIIPLVTILCAFTMSFNLCHQIVQACCRIAFEAKEFNNLLYQLMIDDESSVISTDEKLRLHFTMKREIVFTAYGFFKLDYPLVQSMIAAATTYLVCLHQIQKL